MNHENLSTGFQEDDTIKKLESFKTLNDRLRLAAMAFSLMAPMATGGAYFNHFFWGGFIGSALIGIINENRINGLIKEHGGTVEDDDTPHRK